MDETASGVSVTIGARKYPLTFDQFVKEGEPAEK
jgi:hypothetical protein